MQTCSMDTITSSVIREANHSIMSGETLAAQVNGDNRLDPYRLMSLNNRSRKDINVDQYSSNQLIPYDNPSPDVPDLHSPSPRKIPEALDFSLPPSRMQTIANDMHLSRPHSLPQLQAKAMLATYLPGHNMEATSDLSRVSNGGSPSWFGSSASLVASAHEFGSLRSNGTHLDRTTHGGSEYNTSNGSTPDSLVDLTEVGEYSPDATFPGSRNQGSKPVYLPPIKMETPSERLSCNIVDGMTDTARGHGRAMSTDEANEFRLSQRNSPFQYQDGFRNASQERIVLGSDEILSGDIDTESRYISNAIVNLNEEAKNYNSIHGYSSQQHGSYAHGSRMQQCFDGSNNSMLYQRRSLSSSSSPLSSPQPTLSSPTNQFSEHPMKNYTDVKSEEDDDVQHKGSGKSQSSKTKQPRGAQNLPPCRVCGNKASGLHFGVNTCEACNEFFRRSLKRGATYYCTKNRECQVYGKKRNACSYCRYHRCVEMGMSRDAIKTGRYSHKTRTEYAMEVEEYKQKEMNRAENERYEVLLNDLVKYHDKYINTTTRVLEEELLSRQNTYLNLYNTHHDQDQRHPPLNSGIKNLRLWNQWKSAKEDLCLTMHDVEMTERWLRNYINYAKNVPGFKELALSDQASLVRGSWFEFWFLGAFRGYNSSLGIVAYPIGRCFHRDEIRKVFGEEYTDFSFDLADRMRTLKVTPEEMVLIKTVCLTFPDRAPLQNKEAVDKMHWLMVSCLLHTLERNRPGDTAIFPLIVSKLVELRTLTDIAMRAHRSALFQDVLKDSPLLCEMVDTKTHYVQCSDTKNGVQSITTTNENNA